MQICANVNVEVIAAYSFSEIDDYHNEIMLTAGHTKELFGEVRGYEPLEVFDNVRDQARQGRSNRPIPKTKRTQKLHSRLFCRVFQVPGKNWFHVKFHSRMETVQPKIHILCPNCTITRLISVTSSNPVIYAP